MKRVMVFALCFLTVFSLAACHYTPNESRPEESAESEAVRPEPVFYVPYIGEKAEIADVYVYPVTPADEDWNKRTVQQKLGACRIPQATLNNLSGNALVLAVAEHPFLVDLYVTDLFSSSVPNIEKKIDAYKEILSRAEADRIMLNGMRNLPDFETASKTQLRLDELGVLCLWDAKLDGRFTMQEALEIANYTSSAYLVRTEEEVRGLGQRNSRKLICSDGILYVVWFADGRPDGQKQLSIE